MGIVLMKKETCLIEVFVCGLIWKLGGGRGYWR